MSNFQKLIEVFEKTQEVTKLVLCEVFELKLKMYFHHLLDSDNLGTARFLEYLAMTHEKVSNLTDRIKHQTSQLGLDLDYFIDHLFGNIFGPFISNYFNMEFRNAKNLLEGTESYILQPLWKKHSSLLGDVKQILNQNEETKSTLANLSESIGNLQTSDLIFIMSRANKRCLRLSPESSSNVYQIINLGLDICYVNVFPAIFSRIQSISDFSKYLSRITLMLSELWNSLERYNREFSSELISQLTEPEKSRADSLRKRMSSGMEQNIMKALQRCVSQIVEDCSKLLENEQKKSDYAKVDEFKDNTSACNSTFKFMKEHILNIKNSLPKAQSGVLLASLAWKFTYLVVEHIGKYTVSQEKAMLLSSDMNKYRGIVSECECEDANLEFEKFRQMMNLFMLPAESLPEFIHEEPIASVDSSILAQYISRREDFKSCKVYKLLPSLF